MKKRFSEMKRFKDIWRVITFSIGIIFTLFPLIVKATHNRAGEITFCQSGTNPLTYFFTVTTYTSIEPQVTADRCTLMLYFGDGDSSEISRINGPSGNCPGIAKMGEVLIPNVVKKNVYTGQHTFAGPGCYTVSITDPNRNENIINIPSSVDIPFYIESNFCISPFLGTNCSPQLLNAPIDNACNCIPFIHNPGAFDSDGDSLSYKLTNCKRDFGYPIGGYWIPSGASIDPVTGDFTWPCPGPANGEYNFAIQIISWRNGIAIDTVLRDMQVTVIPNCQNNPPEVLAPDTCVEAGDFLSFQVSASDPDNNSLTLTSTGGVYSLPNSPASFTPVTGPNPVNTLFEWQTNCSHVRKAAYNVTFKATDVPFSQFGVALADLKTVNIQVVSPGPTALTANPSGTTIVLNWIPTVCTEAIGYRIYRRNGPSGFVHGFCETGIPASTGYQLIASVNGSSTSSFTDDNNGSGLIHGVEYCYMIYAWFDDGAESYASNEICANLRKDVPIITHVTVDSTANAGKNTIRWSPPLRAEIDTILYPGPYMFRILRSPGSLCNTLNPADSILNVILPGTATDTVFVHVGLNTKDNSNSYKIEFYNQNPRLYISSSHCASSVYLETSPADNKLFLEWTTNVPWTEDTFTVYRLNNTTSQFDSIGYSLTTQYVDTGLVNGRTYCYKIRSHGFYTSPGIVFPLINFSQETCDEPYDNEPPCAPDLNVSANCDSILNSLSWNNPNLSCADDVIQYRVYYTPLFDTLFQKVAVIDGASNITFEHNYNNLSIAGCYYVTALDSNYNESVWSDTVCVDNCPEYVLPNVFSPNGDNSNDFFRPFPFKYIESIDMKVFNRWGSLVFETNDPNILWDGKNKDSKLPCTDGVYYYICKVSTIRLKGIETFNLNGFVQLFGTLPDSSGK